MFRSYLPFILEFKFTTPVSFYTARAILVFKSSGALQTILTYGDKNFSFTNSQLNLYKKRLDSLILHKFTMKHFAGKGDLPWLAIQQQVHSVYRNCTFLTFVFSETVMCLTCIGHCIFGTSKFLYILLSYWESGVAAKNYPTSFPISQSPSYSQMVKKPIRAREYSMNFAKMSTMAAKKPPSCEKVHCKL